MITFKSYASDLQKVKAVRYSGAIGDAEDLEAMFKGRLRLEFRGCFTGRLLIENHGVRAPFSEQYLNPGDFLIDTPAGLFSLDPYIFDRYYRAAK